MKPELLTTVSAVRNRLRSERIAGRKIGCVPTMGALHEGHISLVHAARNHSDFVVTTIFVNPTQFGPNEDFTKYPRTLDSDLDLLAKVHCDLVFAPSVDEMYPESLTSVEVEKLGDHLCGPRRPGHFRGVCTVVLKLLNIIQPDVAVFGAKDGQQARIIQRMVRDLNVPTEIQIEPTVRESDGLAMSSRNRYLTPAERAAAPGIFQSLLAIRDRVRAGETDVARLESALYSLLSAIPGARIDYATFVDDSTLQPLPKLDRPALAAVAVFLGSTRLIDNISIP